MGWLKLHWQGSREGRFRRKVWNIVLGVFLVRVGGGKGIVVGLSVVWGEVVGGKVGGGGWCEGGRLWQVKYGVEVDLV